MSDGVRSRNLVRFWVALAVLTLLCALALGGITSLASYEIVRGRLVQAYGTERANRYLTPAIFAAAILRLRLAALFLLAAAAGMLTLRRRLARLIEAPWAALYLSFRHFGRGRHQRNLVTTGALVLITLVGLLVRLPFLSQPMRNDESVTVLRYASKPVYIGVSIYAAPNNHLFHTLLVHLFMALSGTSERVIRMPALLAGLLLIPLTYALARMFFSPAAGLIAAALVSCSSILVEYSTNARGYTLICCATVALILAGARLLRRAEPRWFLLFWVASVIGCWTIPIFTIPLGAVCLWLLWEAARAHRRFRRLFWLRFALTLTLAGLTIIVLYLPPIAVSGFNAVFRNDWVAPHELHSFLEQNWLKMRRTGYFWERDLPVGIGWLLAIGFGVATALYARYRRMVASLVLWTLFLFIVRRFVPFERTWLMFLPIYLSGTAAALAWCIQQLASPRVVVWTSALLAVGIAAAGSVPVYENRSVLQSGETGTLPSASSVADFLRSRNIPPNTVFRNRDYDFPFEYYWWRRTGVEPALADRLALEQSNPHPQAWLLVNNDIDETLQSDAAEHGLHNVQKLEERDFPHAELFRISWTPQP